MKHSEQIEAMKTSLKTLLDDITITPSAVDCDWLRERLIDVVSVLVVMATQLHAVAVEAEAKSGIAQSSGE